MYGSLAVFGIVVAFIISMHLDYINELRCIHKLETVEDCIELEQTGHARRWLGMDWVEEALEK